MHKLSGIIVSVIQGLRQHNLLSISPIPCILHFKCQTYELWWCPLCHFLRAYTPHCLSLSKKSSTNPEHLQIFSAVFLIIFYDASKLPLKSTFNDNLKLSIMSCISFNQLQSCSEICIFSRMHFIYFLFY